MRSTAYGTRFSFAKKSPTLFRFLMIGTQRIKKARREKALRAGASRGVRQDAKAREAG